MLRPPPTSTLFPYPTLSRSSTASSTTHTASPSRDPRCGAVSRRRTPLRNASLTLHPERSCPACGLTFVADRRRIEGDRKSTRLNSSHLVISYAVFCLQKKQ